MMYLDGMRETIFFISPANGRLNNVSEAAAHNFVEYWEHQVKLAKDYLANGSNPNTHEWQANG